eukprot:gnl/MRDRNA2_/MRDRNA2_64951_c0_seq1.p1 gnl/MRDRNA2_/MRDRNA2_64951_c0~~gnl/MRDRNA2_/MRDRNA2_64951_c0_seq1.p1  ORF type:complete len:1140 (-),score=191.69 gnl/MRDRNA2_/MRDRNA2_64951_c0_seq1:64-3456(-)
MEDTPAADENSAPSSPRPGNAAGKLRRTLALNRIGKLFCPQVAKEEGDQKAGATPKIKRGGLNFKSIGAARSRLTNSNRAIHEALEILDEACSQDVDDKKYFETHCKAFLQEMLLNILIHRPSDVLDHVQNFIGMCRFRKHYQTFFQEAKIYRVNSTPVSTTPVAQQGAVAAKDSAEPKQEQPKPLSGSQTMPDQHQHHGDQPVPLDSKAKEIVEENPKKRHQSDFNDSATNNVAMIEYARAFDALGGEDALQDARQKNQIDDLLQKFNSTHYQARPVQDSEYDTLPLSKLLEEASAKSGRYNGIIATIAKHTGGVHLAHPPKSAGRAGIKCSLKYSNDAWRLTDLLSNHIDYETFDQLYAAFRYLLTDERVNRFDFYPAQFLDHVVNPKARGYREITCMYIIDQFVCELDLRLKPMVAVHDTSGRVAKRLLDTGADILLLCCIKDYARDAARLLDNGADPNRAKDAHGRTCLHYAATHNATKLVEKLLEHNADPVQADEVGALPFVRALQKGYHHIAAIMLEQVSGRFSEFPSNVQAKCRSMLSYWLDRIRYDPPTRKGGAKVLRLLVGIGSMHDLLDEELRSCATDKDRDMISMLLDVGADINSQPKEGGPNAIDIALEDAYSGDFVSWLVQRGAASCMKCQWRQPELFAAVMRWDLKAVQDFWHQGVNLNCQDERGRTSLDIMLEHFRMQSSCVEHLLDNPSDTGSSPQTFVVGNHIMAFRSLWHTNEEGKHVHKVSKVLEPAIVFGMKEAPPGTCSKVEVRFDFDHETQCIDLAQVPNRKQEVQLLQWMTARGVVARFQTMHEEAIKGNLVQLRFFTSLGINPDARDTYERSPLRIAAQYGHLEVCRHLLSVRAQVGSRDKLGSTALHYAKTPEVASLLIENLADVNLCDEAGNTAMHTAVDVGVCRTLIMSKGSLSQRNSFGQIPLHTAAYNGRLECIVELLQVESSMEATDFAGMTPLRVAQDVASAKCLHEHGAHLTVEEMSEMQQQSLFRSKDPQVPLNLRQQALKLHTWLASQLTMQEEEKQGEAVRVGWLGGAQAAAAPQQGQKAVSKKNDPRWRKFALSERADVLHKELEKGKVWTPPNLQVRDEALLKEMAQAPRSGAKNPRQGQGRTFAMSPATRFF